MLRRAGIRSLLILLAAVGLLIAGVLAVQVIRFGQEDRAAPADVIVVLGAGLYADGTASPGMIRRAAHGAALYAAGYAPYVICSGGYTIDLPISEAQVCGDLLVEDGVPRDVILLEAVSMSTEENAIHTAALMRARGFQTALVTSDNFHLWRASLLFGAQGMELTTSPAQATTGPLDSISYAGSLLREVVALVWQAAKTALGLPVTHL